MKRNNAHNILFKILILNCKKISSLHKILSIVLFQNFSIIVVPVVCFLLLGHSSFAQISGTVFTDGNNNGVLDPTEVGYGNVTINAYKSDGTLASTTNTLSSPIASIGNYMLSGLTAGQAYRIEMITPAGLFSTVGSTGGGTSIQFKISPTPNLNFGLYQANTPANERNPRMIAGCGVTGATVSVASWRYNTHFVSAIDYEIHPHNEDMLNTQVGVPFYLTSKWDGTKNLVFITPIASKFTALPTAPDGDDAIYVADYSNASSGYAYQSNKLLIKLGTLGINTAVASPVTTVAAAQTGEYGLGGISVSNDGKYLYIINLGKTNIIKLDISGVNYGSLPATKPTSFSEIAIPNTVTNPLEGFFRPLCLKMYKGDLYIGGINDGSSSATNSNVRIKVLKMNTTTNTFIEIISFDPTPFTTGNLFAFGNPSYQWRSTFSNKFQVYLNDISFDDTGSLILGITNRKVYSSSSDNDLGYMLRTYRNPSTGTYILENAGVAGLYTSANPLTNYGTDGPGGKLFFENGLENIDGGNHPALFSGGTFILQGTNEILAGYTDPVHTFGFGGRYLNLSSGERKYGTNVGGAKSFAITGTNAVFDPNPIEIGNRIWQDIDKDGIQDAGEPPLVGVTVKLCAVGSTTPIAATVTDANGEYYFSSATTSQIIPGATFDIKITALGSDPSVAGLSLMGISTFTPGESGSTNTGTTTANNDAKLINNIPTIQGITIGNYGENNHTFDFGFIPAVPCTTLSGLTATATPSSMTTGNASALTVTGTGIVAGTTTFSWTGTGGFSSAIQAPSTGVLASAGGYSYTVTATNADGTGVCTTTATTSVNVTAAPVACTALSNVIASATPSSMTTGNASALTVTGTGIVAGTTTFSWTGTGGFSSAIQTPSTGVLAAAGGYSYTVTATNANGTGVCTATATTSVNVTAAPVACTALSNVIASATPSSMTTGNASALTVTGTGIVAGTTTFSWTGTGGFSSAIQAPSTGVLASAGGYSYTVTATNANGTGVCTATATTSVNVTAAPVACTALSNVIASATPSSMTTGNASALTVTGTGIVAGTTTFSWTGTGGFGSAIQAPSTGTIAAAGGYSYTVTATNANGTGVCTATATTSLTVTPACTPPTGISAGISQVTCTAGLANADGKITLSGFTTEKYDLFAGDPYAGTATFATATTIPAGGVIVSNLANPAVSQVYTIRVFNGTNCYTDLKVTLNNKNCSCPVMCEPMTTRKTK